MSSVIEPSMNPFIIDDNTTESTNGSGNINNETTLYPSMAPTMALVDDAEEIHEFDAYTALLLNVTLIGCVLLAYYIKINRIYYIPESGAAMLIGVFIGGMARFAVDDLTLFSFSPEFFFFVLLPPIIFEAGYSLKRKHFFDNIVAITLYAMFGTIISTFVVGYLTLYLARIGLISGTDKDNPMEPLLFGALISAVDPVATLSILGSPDLQCDQLLYSLVFGESVLNDAIAIVLFKSFHSHYSAADDANGELETSSGSIPRVLLSFITMTFFSILVGIGMGLLPSFIYKHSRLSKFPKLETALLFLFCYMCYATAEAIDLSGIMALFFQGVVLSHYNSYNLSDTAHVTSDQIFATLAVITETIVYLYMGMGVFTGKFKDFNFLFTILALFICVIARACNIFPLSFLANCCRKRGRNHISFKMQCVLWFAGLRGAIAFALAENMPGPNKDTYATATLFICMFTTIVCGGFTERVLTMTGMKQMDDDDVAAMAEEFADDDSLYELIRNTPVHRVTTSMQRGIKGVWRNFDDLYLKPFFGGSVMPSRRGGGEDDLGDYELGGQEDDIFDEDSDAENENGTWSKKDDIKHRGTVYDPPSN